MGCDIHMYMEAKVDGQFHMICPSLCHIHGVELSETHRRWVPAIDPITALASDGSILTKTNARWIFVSRSYRLFALLASVRGDSPVGFEPRGLPDDCSALWRDTAEKNDSWTHSLSWLSGNEVNDLYHDSGVDPYIEDHLRELCDSMDEVCTRLGISHEDFRYVFFFDN